MGSGCVSAELFCSLLRYQNRIREVTDQACVRACSRLPASPVTAPFKNTPRRQSKAHLPQQEDPTESSLHPGGQSSGWTEPAGGRGAWGQARSSSHDYFGSAGSIFSLESKGTASLSCLSPPLQTSASEAGALLRPGGGTYAEPAAGCERNVLFWSAEINVLHPPPRVVQPSDCW